MMFKLQRPERRGDRSRTRISMPRERVIPTFNDGMVTVTVAYEASVRRLERLGWVRVPGSAAAPTPAPAPPAATATTAKPAPPDGGPALADLGLDALRKLARDRKIKGRSKMDRIALLQALS